MTVVEATQESLPQASASVDGGMQAEGNALTHCELVNQAGNTPNNTADCSGIVENANIVVSTGPAQPHDSSPDAVFETVVEDTATVAIPSERVEITGEMCSPHIENLHSGGSTMPSSSASSVSYSGGNGTVSAAERVYGSGCSHGEFTPASGSAGKRAHYHFHFYGDKRPQILSEYLSHMKNNAALWLTAAIGATCVGTYFINEYHKDSNKKASNPLPKL